MGTNRMSAKAKDGVVNKFGQTHDIKNLFVSDGSQFTSGAACNPTLTIVALADPAGRPYRRRHAAKGNLDLERRISVMPVLYRPAILHPQRCAIFGASGMRNPQPFDRWSFACSDDGSC